MPLVVIAFVVNASICACAPSGPTLRAHYLRQDVPTDIVILVLRVGLCVLVFPLNLYSAKIKCMCRLSSCLPLKFGCCSAVVAEINDRSYSQLLAVPLVVYSGRWAVTCSRPRCTRFYRGHNRSRGGTVLGNRGKMINLVDVVG